MTLCEGLGLLGVIGLMAWWDLSPLAVWPHQQVARFIAKHLRRRNEWPRRRP